MRVLLPYWKQRQQQFLDGGFVVEEGEEFGEGEGGQVLVVEGTRRVDNNTNGRFGEEEGGKSHSDNSGPGHPQDNGDRSKACEGDKRITGSKSVRCEEQAIEVSHSTSSEQELRSSDPVSAEKQFADPSWPRKETTEAAVDCKTVGTKKIPESPSKCSILVAKRPASVRSCVRTEEASPDRKKRPRVEVDQDLVTLPTVTAIASSITAIKPAPTVKPRDQQQRQHQQKKKLGGNMTGGGHPRDPAEDDGEECDYAANRYLLYTLNNDSTHNTVASQSDDVDNLEREPAQPLENEPPALENQPTFFNVPVASAAAALPASHAAEISLVTSNTPIVNSTMGGMSGATRLSTMPKNAGKKEKGPGKRHASLGEESFLIALKNRGLEIVEQEGDGNCLFRAVSLQVYGDSSMHGEVRERCLDFMARDETYYSQFVTGETFREYIARKRLNGVHGNNPEIQAISELFNRPVEVFTPDTGPTPLNIFHADYKTGDTPIRLSYHDGNHYNAVVDPLKPTAGLGLGMPGLQPGLADKMQVAKAVAESDRMADEMDLKHALQESQQDILQRVIKESSYSSDYMYKSKVMALSDLDATNFELEQAALEVSMESYTRQEQGRKKRAAPRRGRRTSPITTTVTANNSSPVLGTTTSVAARLPVFGDSSNGAAGSPAGVASVPTPSVASLPHASAASASEDISVGAVASRRSQRSTGRHRRDSSNESETQASVAVAAAAALSAEDVVPPVVLAGMGTSADEYPQTVQELVMNGFELSKVIHAFELIGDNFDDLLAFLISTSGSSANAYASSGSSS